VLTAVMVVLEIVCSLALIFLILMHSGKGGSTVVEKNLDRITVTVAVVFAFTNIILLLRLQ
jgi:preprotein translocase subunit SecG